MIHLKIDNIEIRAEEGTTLLEAARKAGISIPSMCHLKGYGNHPACMVCLVKDNKSGAMVPSCAVKVTPGMEISASDEEVMIARRQALELLLSDHVGDCEAPCSLACPAGMNIPLMNRLIGEGRFTEALHIVKEDIALPYILGYICPAPCEKACRRKQIDDAVSVCLLKRFSAATGTDQKSVSLSKKVNTISPAAVKKVAVIGSGPAGLAAAYYLQLYGYSCTIFDKAAEPGGTLRYSIPEEELPKSIIDREVDIIRSMGVTFRCNTTVTRQIFNAEIKGIYDAIVIATGDIAAENPPANLVDLAKSGYLVNEKDMSSAVPGIFVCGSAIRPHKMAVRSVAQGKTAAESVHHFLHEKLFEKPGRIFNSRFEKLLPIEFDEYLKESSKSRRVLPGAKAKEGFSPDEAVREALRCLHCDCRKQDECKLRNYAHEYHIDRKRYMVGDRKPMTRQMQHDLIIYEPEKCIKCGLCVDISSVEGEKFGMAFEGRGFDVVINTPVGTDFNEGLTHTAVKCAMACPTGALALRDKYTTIDLKAGKNEK
jgi:NADPH-dependent glutamate synthase beta subunit-like oxidoreductase/ferredoxin